MFFKRKKSIAIQGGVDDPRIAWDEATLARIVAQDRFDLRVTGVEKLSGFGTSETAFERPISDGYEISGIVRSSKFILATIQLDTATSANFGAWLYDLNSTDHVGDYKRLVPHLTFCVSDPNGDIGTALLEGMKAALICGRKYLSVRFWKIKGDGIMTALDRQKQYSYESRYRLLGMNTWITLEAPNLPPWAAPQFSEKFGLSELPTHDDLRRF